MTRHALLFTDLVDSTLLVERLGDASAAELWTAHDRRARQLLAQHCGREIDRTDGFFLLFDDVADAAHYAIAYHQAMTELRLCARVGIHVGPITLRDNDPADVARGAKPTEVEGLAKPFAARIMALARGGQTLLSASARAAIASTLPDGAELDSHGHYRLKGVEEPAEIFELGVRGLSAFVPPLDTDKVYRVVRAGELWRPLREVRHNLAPERDAFIGRSAELRALAQSFDNGARLLTILGPGGIGKTRVVCRYGLTWLGDWPGGVYFCDLSEARSLDGIWFAVAFALGVPLGKDDPGLQLGHAIAGCGRCLVILDNFEQVLEHAPATLGRWLDRAPEAAFAVTSRERVHLAGEVIFPVEPLPLGTEAVELFAARASAHRPDFVLNQSNRGAVAEVVRLLDGLPLAIELAAARVRVFSPHQLVQRLKDRFHLLAGARGAGARQATLKAVIDWSWQLLTPWEQAALGQCSVFEGGFTIQAAEAVLELSAWPEAPAAMDAVQSLVDKSLLRALVPLGLSRYDIDEPYFGMYLSIHEYAAYKLDASGEAATPRAQIRHGSFFATFGSDDAIEALSRHGGARPRHALALEIDNLVAACTRAVNRGDGGVAVANYLAAWAVFDLQGPLSQALQLGELVLALGGLDPAARAKACRRQGLASMQTGNPEAAQRQFSLALALAQQLGDRRGEGLAMGDLGGLYRGQGRMQEAQEHLAVALAIHREVGNRSAEGATSNTLGYLLSELGQIDEAFGHHEQALAILREVGNRVGESSVLNSLGVRYAEQGRLAEAATHFEQALAISHEVGDRLAEGEVLTNLGCLNQEEGRSEQARSHYDAALAIHRVVGNRRFEGYALGDLGRLHLQQGELATALVCLEQSLFITRETGDRRIEGSELRSLAELFIRQRRLDEARAAVAAGETVLRQVGDKFYLALTLCARAELERCTGDIDAARAACDEADALAASIQTGAQSELGRKVAAMRESLI